METFGSIVDKLCILERRMKELKNKDKPYYFLYEQQGWLIKSLGEVLEQSYKNERPFVFKKNKVYDKGTELEEDISFLEAINKLNECNNKLWELEDVRRDKSVSDEGRLEAADQVSVYNKLRNDSMDRIDQNIEKAARVSHPNIFIESREKENGNI